jgi:hypothetical protein
MGSTKKQAEQDAARRALDRLAAAGAKAGALAVGAEEKEEAER